MDDLFLFTTPKKSHIAKLEDLLRKVSILEKKCNIWGIPSLLRIGESVLSH